MNRLWAHIVLAVMLLVMMGCTDTRSAREGNRNYQNSEFAEAETAFTEASDALNSDPENGDKALMRADVLNNRAAARYRQAKFSEAQDDWLESVRSSTEDIDRISRALYNAGTNAYRMDDKNLALEYLRRALLVNPSLADAKINYEFIARQLQNEEGENGGGGKPPEPSDYARQLKEQADALVEQQLYREAFDLLRNGLEVDPTVAAYQDFMARDSVVSNIHGQ